MSQRVVHVLGHEVNNNFAPTKSIAPSLTGQLAGDPTAADPGEDLATGLDVIAAARRAPSTPRPVPQFIDAPFSVRCLTQDAHGHTSC